MKNIILKSNQNLRVNVNKNLRSTNSKFAKSLFNFVFKSILILLHPLYSFGQIISDDTEIKIIKNLKVISRKVEIKINNKSESQLGIAQIFFQKDDNVTINEAVITDTLGNILREISPKQIITKNEISEGSFYEDNYVKEIQMIWNHFPYHIKYKYTLEKKEFIQIANWYPATYFNTTTLSASLKVDVPLDYKIHINNSPDIEYTVEEEKGSRIYFWHLKKCILYREENLSLPPSPAVVINPENFLFFKPGSNKSWNDYGKWIHSLNENMDEITVSEKAIVRELVGKTKDTLEIIKILHEYRQKSTRYLNVSINEGNLKPYPPNYVCLNRFGDCKALTIYMKALLKYFGIESSYVLVYAGVSPLELNQNFPGHQFNHVILGIPLHQDTIWLENTSQNLPLNYLGTFTQGRKALWIDRYDSKLINLPELTFMNTGKIFNQKYSIDTSNVTKFESSILLMGAPFESISDIENQPEAEIKDYIKDLLELKPIKNSDFKYEMVKLDLPAYKINLSGQMKNFVRRINNTSYIKLNEFKLPNFEIPEKRKTDVLIPFPLFYLDSIKIEITNSLKADTKLPKNIEINSKYGYFYEGYQSISKNEILFIREFKIYKNKISISEYNFFFTFVEKVKESMKQSFIQLN